MAFFVLARAARRQVWPCEPQCRSMIADRKIGLAGLAYNPRRTDWTVTAKENNMMRRKIFVIVSALLASLVHPSAQERSWRPTVVAQHGMVAAGHPLAAEAGMRILKAGGNAIDAAMATWAVQGQVEPGMTGLGADMFILYYNAKTHEVKFINGTGFAPQAATIELYKGKGGIPDDGPLTIAVPGAVGGAAFAVQKYGTKPLAEVFAPAIEIAEQGFPITEALAQGLKSSRAKLAKFPSTTKIWFK